MKPEPLPTPPKDAHKGDFGRLFIIGGQDHGGVRMIGAPALAARAAVRTGVGLVRIAAPETVLSSVITLCPSATGLVLPDTVDGADTEVFRTAVAESDCVIIGPGLGTHANARAVFETLLDSPPARLLVDADGLNLLAEAPELMSRLPPETVLTPHVGEFNRLAEAMELDLGGQTADGNASSMSDACSCVVVRKSARTTVADGSSVWRCERGHVCLATGGTGDVLSGVIGSLLADQTRHVTPFNASVLGVDIHARAAELWASRHRATRGMLPTELTDCIPETMERLRSPDRPTNP